MLLNLILIVTTVIWIGCLVTNLSLILHYARKKDDFLIRSFLRSLKFNYTGDAEEMSQRDRKLYLLTWIGVVVFFIPAGYFLGGLLHGYLKGE